MYISRFLNRHFNKYTRHVKENNVRTSNSIIRINIRRLDSLDACTYGGLYCSAEPLPMDFTLLHTRLVHNHLGPLSCQRQPPHALAIWISSLYVRLIDSLEIQDATLLESLSDYIHYNTTMKSHQETHGITSSSYHIHVPTPSPHVISKHHNLMPMHNPPTNS